MLANSSQLKKNRTKKIAMLVKSSLKFFLIPNGEVTMNKLNACLSTQKEHFSIVMDYVSYKVNVNLHPITNWEKMATVWCFFSLQTLYRCI